MSLSTESHENPQSKYKMNIDLIIIIIRLLDSVIVIVTGSTGDYIIFVLFVCLL